MSGELEVEVEEAFGVDFVVEGLEGLGHGGAEVFVEWPLLDEEFEGVGGRVGLGFSGGGGGEGAGGACGGGAFGAGEVLEGDGFGVGGDGAG